MANLFSRINSNCRHLTITLVAPVLLKCVFLFLPRRKKTLLVVKNDGIGDYVLFRNYLQVLRKSDKYKGYKIYLLGNPLFEELSRHLDASIIDGFYGCNDSFFIKWKLLKVLYALQRLRPEEIIYTNYSRKYNIDWLINNITAIKKIAIN